jgi:arsenate reductase
MIFANTNKEITLIYNSEEPIGRQILADALKEKITVHDIDLKHIKLTPTQWAGLASKLHLDIGELVDTKSAGFLKKFGQVEDLTSQDWLSLLAHNPDILKAPIVLKGSKTSMITSPQDVLTFLK